MTALILASIVRYALSLTKNLTKHHFKYYLHIRFNILTDENVF